MSLVDRLSARSLECRHCSRANSNLAVQVVSFKQISQILELTDSLGLNREWVEIPLSPEGGGIVRTLSNGKLEIVVAADQPFETWLARLKDEIGRVHTPPPA
jgi:hypothetical protein